MMGADGARRPRRHLLQVVFVRVPRENAGLLFVLPTVLVLAAVIGYPVVRTFWLSLSKVKLGADSMPFQGLANYQNVLTDSLFHRAIRNTLVWTALSVGFVILIGLLAALTVNERFRGRAVFRAAILLPWTIPGIAAALIWKWLYHPNFGMVNDVLMRSGLVQGPTNWLASPTWALYAVVAVNVWKGFPFAMLMLLAGLQSIPEALYDAARVDGAGIGQRMLYVTLPLLRPVILVIALLLTVWNMNTFTYIYVLTEGGPARLTEVFGVYIYTMAFRSFKFGMASAAAVVVFAISTLLSVAYLRMLPADEAD